MSKRFTGILVLLMIAALVGTMAAQVIKGSISGTVTDPQGAVISGATVKATNVDNSALTYTTTTDSGGAFHFNLIPSGNYKVEISHGTDYRPAVRDNVLVSAGADTGLGNVKMILGTAETTVEVKAEAAPLVTNEAQITNTFSGAPLATYAGTQENQGLDNMALQIPGVTAIRSDSQFSNANGTSFSVNGLRGRNNDQQIDGQNNNDNSVAGPATFLTNTEFVSQYVAITNEFGPEYGRNSGSVVNVITKSGSNSWHGSVFGSENNSILNSVDTNIKQFSDDTKLPRFNNEFGGFTIGGPFIKNKMFFFGGFDQQIQSGSTIFQTDNLSPTPAGLATLAACFPGSASLNAYSIFGAYGISAGNPTPVSADTQLVNETGCAGVEESGVQRTLPTPVHQFDWMWKNDIVLTNDNISIRYLFNRLNFFNTEQSGATAAAMGWLEDVPALSQSLTTSWTHNLSSRMVNEARVSFSRLNVEFGGDSFNKGDVTANNLGDNFTNIVFSTPGLANFGTTTSLPQSRIVNTWQVQDNWNYILGKHSIKAGVNWTYQRSPNTFLPNLNGAYRFSNWGTFAANTPNRVRIASGQTGQDFREYDTFLYLGDTWKLRSNLSITGGLTWTYFGQPVNLLHDETVKRESGSTPFWNPALPLSIRTVAEVPTDYTLFGPSLGFAYTPQWGGFITGHGKTVIRGGFRMTVDPPYYNIYLNEATAAPTVFLQTVCQSAAAGGPTCATVPNSKLPAVPTGPNVRAALAPSITLGVFDPRTFAETNVSPNFTADKTEQWNLGFQRQIGNNMAFEARYVGNHAYNLFQSVDANPLVAPLAADFPNLVPAGITPCATTQQVLAPTQLAGTDVGRVNCGEGVVRQRTNTGYSHYNALQVELRANNLFKQLTLRSAYTWSKTQDNVSEIFGTFAGGNTLAFSQNPLDISKGEYALSGLDIPHNWSLAFNEDLPFFRDQKGAIGHVLGGWTLAGNYLLGSGEAWTPYEILFPQFGFQANNYDDISFLGSFNSGFDDIRPFLSNPNAPQATVGIYGGDSGCATATQLYNFADWNTTGACNPVNATDVRYIFNGTFADGVFGTPFGTAPRNSAREAITNIGNFSVFKKIKVTEKVAFTFHTTFLNVFNHPNYVGIDPFLEDAGFHGSETGFGDPSVWPGGFLTPGPQRQILFGGKLTF